MRRHLTLVLEEASAVTASSDVRSIETPRPADCVFELPGLDAQGRRQFVAVDECSRELERLSAANDEELRFVTRWLIRALEAFPDPVHDYGRPRRPRNP